MWSSRICGVVLVCTSYSRTLLIAIVVGLLHITLCMYAINQQ